MPTVIPTFNPERRDWPFAGKAPQVLLDDDGALWEPWSNGSDIGFRITNADGDMAYVFLAPSTGSGDGQPTAFLYEADSNADPADGADPVTSLAPHEGFRPHFCSTCGTEHGRCCPLRMGFAGMTAEDARQAAWFQLHELGRAEYWQRRQLDAFDLVQVAEHIRNRDGVVVAPAGSVVLARHTTGVDVSVVLSMVDGALHAVPCQHLHIRPKAPAQPCEVPA